MIFYDSPPKLATLTMCAKLTFLLSSLSLFCSFLCATTYNAARHEAKLIILNDIHKEEQKNGKDIK